MNVALRPLRSAMPIVVVAGVPAIILAAAARPWAGLAIGLGLALFVARAWMVTWVAALVAGQALAVSDPAVALECLGGAAALAIAVPPAVRLFRDEARVRALARTAAVIAAPVVIPGAGVGLALLLAAYPATALLLAALGLICFLAVRAPLAAVFAAVLLFECEGMIKIALTAGGNPAGVGAEGLGAAALDLGVVIASLAVLARDRLAAPRLVWREAGRLERAVLALVPVWLALSVLQIAQSPSIKQGVDGFRLEQGYVLIVLVGLTVSRRFERRRIVAGLLAVAGVLAGYAALRTATGLTPAEQGYAISRSPNFAYGSTFRSIGSLGSAVSLASVITPLFAMCASFGLVARRWRGPAWAIAALAAVAAFFTYTRVSILAMVAAVVGAAILWVVLARPSRLRVLVAIASTMALIGVIAAGVVASSSVSHSSSQRAQGFVDPAGDASIQERIDTWHRSLVAFAHQPLGRGVGAIGGAAQVTGNQAGSDVPGTTDNSFLKVLVEQGIIGTPPFVLGALGIVLVVGVRLRRAAPAGRALGLAALAGYASFLLLWTVGEYIEQPGKVIAWLLLGIALGEAYRPALRGRGGGLGRRA